MNWNIINDLDDQYYMQHYHIHSILAKVFSYHRYTDLQIQQLFSQRLIYHNFDLFLEGEMALERIEEAIVNKEMICIYGDYDCDGILATSILVQAFKKRGVQVGYHIPDRFSDGYGLNTARVEQIAQKGYRLIITVDNGVKANEAINRANELGIDVIVSDHHSYDELPDATAIIHTKMSPEYPFKEISGGFIAYKLAVAINNNVHDKYLFCLAAITTISDMMPLVDENRSLVIRALQFMKENKYPSIELLLGKNQTYNATAIGFQIAPKINSLGRLPEYLNPNHLVKYFFEDCNESFREQVALKASQINEKRKLLTKNAYPQVIEEYDDQDFLYSYRQDVHQGLVGLIASRFTNDYHKPSFVLKYDNDKDIYVGSARSVAGLPLPDLFDYCQDDLLFGGGHALAGGFSVSKDHILDFKHSIERYLKENDIVFDEPTCDAIALEPEELTIANIKELQKIEPFGLSNEEPLFMLKNLVVEQVVPLKNNQHVKFVIKDLPLECLYFNQEDISQYFDLTHIQPIGKLSIQSFRNKETMKLIIEDMK